MYMVLNTIGGVNNVLILVFIMLIERSERNI